jgi:hypothetical protein
LHQYNLEEKKEVKNKMTTLKNSNKSKIQQTWDTPVQTPAKVEALTI